MSNIRILGIDPGSQRTGFAILDFSGQKFSHVSSGYLKLGRGDMAQRLGRIYQGVSDMIEQHQPDAAAVETVFVQKNVASAIKLGQARGAAIAAIACHSLDVAEYAPTRIKQSICGGGHADKSQINFMVRRIVAVKDELQEDQADALAVAICHGFHCKPKKLGIHA